MSDIEKLTEAEYTYLRRCMSHPGVLKALRIIDAHEADRAALVARAEAAERTRQDDLDELERLATEAAALRAELTHLRGEHLHPCGAREADMLALRAELAEARAATDEMHQQRNDMCQSLISANTQLAEARALLVDAAALCGIEELQEQPAFLEMVDILQAFLTANPESPHAAAERVVLDAVRRWVDGEVTSVAHIAAAEHARRAVKP